SLCTTASKKVHWHGLSSGTRTAHTFAALYPETVGKLMLEMSHSPTTSLPPSSTWISPQKHSSPPAMLNKLKSTSFQSPSPGLSIDWSAFHRFRSAVILDCGVVSPHFRSSFAEIEAGVPGSGTHTATGIISSPPLDDSRPSEHVITGTCIDARHGFSTSI
ncbi:hypothetical protein PMIN01_05983, partial [Paraphaeosphaeria minitans]